MHTAEDSTPMYATDAHPCHPMASHSPARINTTACHAAMGSANSPAKVTL